MADDRLVGVISPSDITRALERARLRSAHFEPV
jgi:hypothetical protein